MANYLLAGVFDLGGLRVEVFSEIFREIDLFWFIMVLIRLFGLLCIIMHFFSVFCYTVCTYFMYSMYCTLVIVVRVFRL